jgi:hypothetical protein
VAGELLAEHGIELLLLVMMYPGGLRRHVPG